ncbi:IclR family transcriptional regulator [Pseudomonadota bacterium]
MKTVRSVERAISILFLVCQSDRPLRLADISRGVSLDKATTLRLLNTLVGQKLVQQETDTRRYLPGSDISRLHSFWGSDLRNVSRPHLEKLLHDVEETVCLITPRGYERVCIDALQPDRELRIVAAIGKALPIHTGASGRVLMAYKSPEEVENILDDFPLAAFTEHTTTSRQVYLQQLIKVKDQGYAFSVSDVTDGSSALAAPVMDQTGNITAVIAIRGPEMRLTREKGTQLLGRLKQTTSAITTELSYK